MVNIKMETKTDPETTTPTTVVILKPLFIDNKLSYDNLWYYTTLYAEELFETSLVFVLLYFFSNRKIEKGKLISSVLVISFIMFIVELFQPIIKKNMKAGIVGTVGSMFIKNTFTK